MKRTELFPIAERTSIMNMLEAWSSGEDHIKYPASEKQKEIFIIKIQLLKYVANRPKLFYSFQNECPLCDNYLYSAAYSHCVNCPWNTIEQIDEEFACEKWMEKYSNEGICRLNDEELKDIKKDRVTMLYEWLEYYLGN